MADLILPPAPASRLLPSVSGNCAGNGARAGGAVFVLGAGAGEGLIDARLDFAIRLAANGG